MLVNRKMSGRKNLQNDIRELTLEDYVKGKGPLELEEIYSITLNLCEALDDIESIDYFGSYPQLKLSNVILTESGKATLIVNNILKTNKDFLSIGMIMYFMATGKRLFTVLEPIFDDNYADNVDHDLKRIIRKCFEIDTKNQYASIKELSKDLSIMILKKNMYRQTRDLCDSSAEVYINTRIKKVKRTNKSKEKLKVIGLSTVIAAALRSMQYVIKMLYYSRIDIDNLK